MTFEFPHRRRFCDNDAMSNVSSEPAVMESAPPKQRNRRWFRFSLRTLLILFAVVAAILHFWVIPSERQRRACEKIVAMDGIFSFDREDLTDRTNCFPLEYIVHRYDHFFHNVTAVDLYNRRSSSEIVGLESESTDRRVAPDIRSILENLPHIRFLVLNDFPCDVLQMGNLANSVEELIISVDEFNDEEMNLFFSMLATYKHLRRLGISWNQTHVPYKKFVGFENIPNLQQLIITGGSVRNDFQVNRIFSLENMREFQTNEQKQMREEIVKRLSRKINSVEID